MMTIPFDDLIDRYDAFLFDSYGVIKNYQGIIDGVPQVLERLRKVHKRRYRILTNDASCNQDLLSEKFKKGGIFIRPHRIITSGLMAQHFLMSKTIHGKVLYLGTPSSSAFIDEAGLEKLSINEYHERLQSDIGCVLFLDDEGFDLLKAVNHVINLLRQRHIPAIVANSDLIYPVSANSVSMATGSIARLVEHILGRTFIHFGKPDIQMFMYAYDDLRRDDPGLDRARILMIGDTLHTDILGGIKFGIDTCLVLTGNTSPNEVEVAVGASGIVPDYIADSILT